MVDDQHEPEDLIQFLRFVRVLGTLEERDEDVELPIFIQFALLLVYLIHLQDRGWLE